LADQFKITYGGSGKINFEGLSLMYKSLRTLWQKIKDLDFELGNKPINFQITSAQAALTAIKSGRRQEDNFKDLIKHLEILKFLLEQREKQAMIRA